MTSCSWGLRPFPFLVWDLIPCLGDMTTGLLTRLIGVIPLADASSPGSCQSLCHPLPFSCSPSLSLWGDCWGRPISSSHPSVEDVIYLACSLWLCCLMPVFPSHTSKYFYHEILWKPSIAQVLFELTPVHFAKQDNSNLREPPQISQAYCLICIFWFHIDSVIINLQGNSPRLVSTSRLTTWPLVAGRANKQMIYGRGSSALGTAVSSMCGHWGVHLNWPGMLYWLLPQMDTGWSVLVPTWCR